MAAPTPSAVSGSRPLLFDGEAVPGPHERFEFVGERFAQGVLPLRNYLTGPVWLDFCYNQGG